MTEVTSTHENGLLEITLCRPDKQNALTCSMYEQIDQLLKEADQSSDIKAVLLRGEGAHFCAGNDIQDFVHASAQPEPFKHVVSFLHGLVDFDKPLVAAVHGNAVGIGTTLLLHCDYVAGADNLRCRLPFVQLGLVPEAGSTLLLPMLLGQRHAFDAVTSGHFINAFRAQKMGLVNEVFAQDDFLSDARQQAKRLAALPAQALVGTKRLLKAPIRDQLHQVIDEEIKQFRACLTSAEAQDAFQAFLSKGA